jgi:hypothetical protein
MPMRGRQKEDALSLEEVRSLLSYDPETGALNWIRPPRRGVSIGPAGCINTDGYKVVGYKGHLYMAIHLIWFIQTGEWPEHGVDHKDRDPRNDRWSNLRLATYSQNNQNMPLRKDNLTGVRGVGFESRRGMFYARIRKDHQLHWLGYHATLAGAESARQNAELKLFGEFSPLHEGLQ